MSNVRWYSVCAAVALGAYGLSMALLALTEQLTSRDALLSVIPVVAIFGALAWCDRPTRDRPQR